MTTAPSSKSAMCNSSSPAIGRGTLIEIARGRQRKVEDLKIGDKVRTASGALRPIKWIGRRSYGGRFILGRKDILPVCFKAGSLGDNVPERDLWISPQHAMYFASGKPWRHADRGQGSDQRHVHRAAEHTERVDYFHIELDTHDVIVAEGALSETFIDDDSRGIFHNVHEYETLYADEDAAPAHYCAPRLNEGYEVEAVRQRLMLRAEFRRDVNAPRQATQHWRTARLYRSRPLKQHRRLGAKHRRLRSAGLSRHFRRRQADRSGAGERLSRRPQSRRPRLRPSQPSPSRRRQASSLLPDR